MCKDNDLSDRYSLDDMHYSYPDLFYAERKHFFNTKINYYAFQY